MISAFRNLPLYASREEILAAANSRRNLLITAPTGSGKSSFIPLLLKGEDTDKRIAVLQPRRLAALTLARYLAQKIGEPCGETIGYQFRFESSHGANTRILFETYGSFLQRLTRLNPLPHWILFDEFHERRKEMDLLMGYFLALQKINPEAPRIAVLSAELQKEVLEKYLGTPCLSLSVPAYPVQMIHQNPRLGEPLETQVIRALRTLSFNGYQKTTLVFLPGKREIFKTHNAVESALGNHYADYFDLYGGQSSSIQTELFQTSEKPRVIFCTNIAETSLTIPGVTGVIDSGLEKTSDYQTEKNREQLSLGRISLQNALQRTGRAGRTEPGLCVRLWSEEEEHLFPKNIIPEVLRTNITEWILKRAILAEKLKLKPEQIPLLTHPKTEIENKASEKLKTLKFLDENNRVTLLGMQTENLPVSDPDFSALLLTAPALSDLTLAAVARILETPEKETAKTALNLGETLPLFLENPSQSVPEVNRLYSRLLRYRQEKTPHLKSPDSLEETARILYQTFPLNLATIAKENYRLGNETLTLKLPEETRPETILTFRLIRTGNGAKSELKTSLYFPVPPQIFSNTETVRYELIWKNAGERYIGLEIRKNGELEISRKEILPGETSEAILETLKKETAAVWIARHNKEDLSHLWFDEENQTLFRKMKLAAALFPEYGFPAWTEEDLHLVTDDFMTGIFLLRDLSPARFRESLEEYFGKSMLPWLHKMFPENFTLQNGRKAKYQYFDDVVELSARLGDLIPYRGEHFIAEGKLKVRYDILAPNYRTVQKTWDLTGFWKNTYPEIRKELRGRYPKHPWPESV